MRNFRPLKAFLAAGLLCFSASFFACSDDSSSSSDSDETSKSTSSASGSTSGSSGSDSEAGSTSSSASTSSGTSSSSTATVTQTSGETLNEASNVVNGTCAPTASISKGGIATWKFYRSEGEVFDQILAPFVWIFDKGSEGKDTISGNGLNSVNVAYPNSGSYGATLSVDGNSVTCTNLQVNGTPITVESCEPDLASAWAGETITWTVVATSESDITGYTWTSDYGTVTGNGAQGSLVATSDMHKTNVNVNVTVTNEDKTSQYYSCATVLVTDSTQVDVVLGTSEVTLPSGEDLVVQVSSSVSDQCQMVCTTTSSGVILTIDGVETTMDYSYTGNLASPCAGKKYTMNVSLETSCYITY